MSSGSSRLPKKSNLPLSLPTRPRACGQNSFHSSPDYRGTELLRDAYIPGAYLTIDRWTSEEAFRAFRKEHDAEYEALDRACDPLTSSETRIGAYTV